MKEYKLNKNIRCKFNIDPAKRKLIDADSLVAVYIEDILINPSFFDSKDLSDGEREGVLQLYLSGQKTIIPFKGISDEIFTVDEKYLNKIAYLGINPVQLSIQYHMIELDQKSRQILKRGGEIAQRLGKAPLTGIHPALGPALTLIHAALDVAHKNIDDDVERLTYLISETLVKAEGEDLLISIENDPKIKIVFRIEDLGRPEAHGNLSVRINRPQLSLNDEVLNSLGKNKVANFLGLSRIDFIQEFTEFLRNLIHKPDESYFNFQGVSGKNSAVFSARLNEIERYVSWGKREIFKVIASKKEGFEHNIIPLTLNFSINNKASSKNLLHALETSLTLAESSGINIGSTASTIKKNGQSILSLLSELSGQDFSLYAFDGFVLLNPSQERLEMKRGRIALRRESISERWIGDFNIPLKFKDTNLGLLSFVLEIKEL